ncbi:hypothetical protein EJB05_12609, partial [Eragrostis curvula]
MTLSSKVSTRDTYMEIQSILEAYSLYPHKGLKDDMHSQSSMNKINQEWVEKKLSASQDAVPVAVILLGLDAVPVVLLSLDAVPDAFLLLGLDTDPSAVVLLGTTCYFAGVFLLRRDPDSMPSTNILIRDRPKLDLQI